MLLTRKPIITFIQVVNQTRVLLFKRFISRTACGSILNVMQTAYKHNKLVFQFVRVIVDINCKFSYPLHVLRILFSFHITKSLLELYVCMFAEQSQFDSVSMTILWVRQKHTFYMVRNVKSPSVKFIFERFYISIISHSFHYAFKTYKCTFLFVNKQKTTQFTKSVSSSFI